MKLGNDEDDINHVKIKKEDDVNNGVKDLVTPVNENGQNRLTIGSKPLKLLRL